MSTRTRTLAVLIMAILLAGMVLVVTFVGQRADAAEHDLYRANHQVLVCEGLRLELSTDSTDAHIWAKDHCRTYDFPANDDFDPKA